ncbi:MAG: MotA/TolQ/ExbB proton channel family protein [SAR324 cluster bacterium]|nr:MotA/TolQ/ExbB proton channel family protein [SAR324 cluster bacterium]
MDLATVIGMCLAYFFMIVAIGFDFSTFTPQLYAFAWFIDIPSLLTVLGGTIASTMASYPMDMFKTVGKSLKSVYSQQNIPLVETLTLIVDVSKIARKNILAIEDALPSIENLYLRGGLRLVVDRVDRNLIVEMLSHELKYADEGRAGETSVVSTMGSLCPAWGMLGTLIGLVILLQNLDDPSKIGPAMAIALITTLYGSIFANTIFIPTANKMSVTNADQKLLMEMIRDGVLYIEQGERPDFIEQDLVNYLHSDQKAMYEQLKFDNEKKED